MDFTSNDLKPFRIPKRTESPPKPTTDVKPVIIKSEVKPEVKKEMPPLPTVSKRHQIASIEFETNEKSPKVTTSPAGRKKDERANRKRQSSSSNQKHQSAPLDNIMSEMSRDIKRQKKHQESHEKEMKPFAEEPPVLTKDYLENRPAHDDFVDDFLNREDILEKLLGHKMKHNRLEPYPNIGFRRMTDAEVADEKAKKMAYFSVPGPSGEQKPTSPPMGGRRPKGPKTPPGSPGGPRTPPGPPPPLPPLTPPGDQPKMFSQLSAISGMNPQQLEAYFGAEVSKTIATMDQTTLLESIKTAIVSAGQGKTPNKPPEPRRSSDSVQMELVSDCSLSPMNGDDDDSILAPPPPPPVIEPPPPPPTLPPMPPPPIWPPIVNTSIPPPNLPPMPMPPKMHHPVAPPFPPPSGPPKPLMSMNVGVAPPPSTHVPPPRFSMNIPPPPPPASTEISVSSTAEVPSVSPEKPPPPAAVPLPPAVTIPPPPAAPVTTPSWMASTSNLPSWSDENTGDWSKEDSWIPKEPAVPVAPVAPEPTPNVETPSSDKITNTLLSALGLGGGGGGASGAPGTSISGPSVAPSPMQSERPLLDRYGCPLPVPSSMPRGLPPPHPGRGRGRGGPPRGGGRGGGPGRGFQTPPSHLMSPMGPPQQRNLRYPHMGNSPMARPPPQMPRRRGAGGRAMKLPS